MKKNDYLKSIKQCNDRITICIVKLIFVSLITLSILLFGDVYYDIFYELTDGSKYLMLFSSGIYILIVFSLIMYISSIVTDWDANRIHKNKCKESIEYED